MITELGNYIRDKRVHNAFFSNHQHLILFLLMTEQDRDLLPSTSDTVIHAITSYEPSTAFSLKRRASPSFEGLEEDSRKRMKENDEPGKSEESGPNTLSSKPSLVDELAEELQCGCCSELVYKPVIVAPCQHFFCGRSFLHCHNL
jgi:E3 ubiquitin-protein ligase CHFR